MSISGNAGFSFFDAASVTRGLFMAGCENALMLRHNESLV
jgi:hypothetical protein